MTHNIAAVTLPTGAGYPAYLSINEVEENGDIAFTVRSARKSDGGCGETSCIVLSRGEFNKVVHEIMFYSHLNKGITQL